MSRDLAGGAEQTLQSLTQQRMCASTRITSVYYDNSSQFRCIPTFLLAYLDYCHGRCQRLFLLTHVNFHHV